MSIFQTDFKRLLQQLLPTFLRKPLIKAFISAISSAINALRNRFNLNRDRNLYNLSITPQVCYLEKVLNDKFDFTQRRIYINNGDWRAAVSVFLVAENNPVALYLTSENQPIPLYLQTENGYISESFMINVPTELQPSEQDLRGIVNLFKLAGKVYSINYF